MMANLSEDIHCAGSDTRPPMLNRSDFESWQQRIRLYCIGKDNGVNIHKSIDEGPFKMGKFRETLPEGALHLGPELDRVFADLTPKEKERFKADIHETNILLQVKLDRGLKTSNYDQLYAYLKQHEAHANENKMMLERYNQHAIDPLAFVSNVSPLQYNIQSSAVPQSAYVPPGRQNRGQGNNARGAVAAGNGRQCTHPKRPQNSEYFKDKMLLMQAQENGVVLDEEQLLFIASGQTNMFDDDVDEEPIQDLALNEDNVFQADQCDAFDFNVDEAPMAHIMFMANLSSADPIYDKAGPSYDLNILSEVQDHDNYIDSVSEYLEVHEMQNDVQPSYVVDSDAEYTSNSNIIPYEYYVKDNVVQVCYP
ncbi:hypothetical protein Tco_1023955 [Tanacetum coccineum]